MQKERRKKKKYEEIINVTNEGFRSEKKKIERRNSDISKSIKFLV